MANSFTVALNKHVPTVRRVLLDCSPYTDLLRWGFEYSIQLVFWLYDYFWHRVQKAKVRLSKFLMCYRALWYSLQECWPTLANYPFLPSNHLGMLVVLSFAKLHLIPQSLGDSMTAHVQWHFGTGPHSTVPQIANEWCDPSPSSEFKLTVLVSQNIQSCLPWTKKEPYA